MESSSKAFSKSLYNLQLEYNTYIDNSVETTIKVLYDVGFFDRFENEEKVFLKSWHLKTSEEKK